MSDFDRIKSARNPTDFLRAPMEREMIPSMGSFLLDRFDRDFGLAPEIAECCGESASPISNAEDVEEELFDRYLQALQLKFGNEIKDAVDVDGLNSLAKGQQRQRARIGLDLSTEFARLRPNDAFDREWGTWTEARSRRVDVIGLCLEFGYIPPLPAADLIKYGTDCAPNGRKCVPLSIAKKIPGNPDANKNLVRRPWPRGFFDRTIRIYLFYTAAGRAYRRAYDHFFIYSQCEIVRCGEQWLAIPQDEWCEHEGMRRALREATLGH